MVFVVDGAGAAVFVVDGAGAADVGGDCDGDVAAVAVGDGPVTSKPSDAISFHGKSMVLAFT